MPYADPNVRRKRHTAYLRDRYRNDPEYRTAQIARVRACDARRLVRFREIVAEFRKWGCLLCGEREACCLTAHHVEPGDKEFNISEAVRGKVGMKRMISELAKCVCLCQNCHAKVHAGILKLP